MSVVVAFDRHPVAVYPDLEQAACAVESLPLDADERVTCYALPEGKPLRDLWVRHNNGNGDPAPGAAGGGAPITLSIH